MAHYDPNEEITIVSGATEAIFVAISTVITTGDEVIVFEPAYDSYVPAIELNGGIPIYISLKYPEYSIDWDLVKDSITEKTKLIIINTPHNPTGRVWTEYDFKALTDIIQDKNIYLIGDEVYEHILFDKRTHLSLCSTEFLKSRSFVCGSFGKTLHVTGWKIGYCLAPKALSLEFRKIHQYVTFSTFTAAQLAIAEYLTEESNYLNVSDFYQNKRDLFLNAISKSRFSFIPSQGSFFQNLSYKAITDKNDYEFAVELTKTIGIASIPVSVFYHNKLDEKVLRFCFAKEDETLLKAGEILSKI
jgi:methionine aminotransferase